MLTASKIIAALPTLTREDRQRITDFIRALDGGTERDGLYDPEHKDWLLSGIHEELVQRGLLAREGRVSLCHMIKRGYQHFPEHSLRVRMMLERACRESLTPTQRAILGLRAAESLVLWLERSRWRDKEGRHNYELSAENMLKYVEHVPAAFNQQFPGYLAAGIVGFMLPKTKKGSRDGKTK